MSHKLAKQIRKNHGVEFREALKNDSGKFKVLSNQVWQVDGTVQSVKRCEVQPDRSIYKGD